MQALFWILLFLIFYTYFGYGLVLLLCKVLFRRKEKTDESLLPSITFIVPAYNEEDILRQKIENSLALDYPADKISFVFITDGSSDGTPQIVSEYPQIRLLHHAKRQGKSAAVNRAMQAVQTSAVVFSDANTMVHPQSLRKLVRHYADEGVGGVSGEKRIATKQDSPVSFGEKLYWQYESRLKKASSGFYTLVGAAGELFSIRTALFKPLREDIILDDFVLSATVCLQGYRFVYEAEAFGLETSSATFSEEQKRKVRISAGCYQALVALPQLLNPTKNFRLAFQYFSHRVLRWAVCPLALPLLFLCNAWLCFSAAAPFYVVFFTAQCAFYLLAVLGRLAASKRSLAKPVLVPAYFVFMVLSQYAGFARFVARRQPAAWEKARRQPVA